MRDRKKGVNREKKMYAWEMNSEKEKWCGRALLLIKRIKFR